ncbi:hypothetical protein NOVO_09445 (plasmid) [Rickettsiales bacterium Ac37b]|nr:hypothetical protein NOVO_09445 [Rickettsiales bacterium Ac37b]
MIFKIFLAVMLCISMSEASEYKNLYIYNGSSYLPAEKIEANPPPIFAEQYGQFGDDIALVGILKELGLMINLFVEL